MTLSLKRFIQKDFLKDSWSFSWGDVHTYQCSTESSYSLKDVLLGLGQTPLTYWKNKEGLEFLGLCPLVQEAPSDLYKLLDQGALPAFSTSPFETSREKKTKDDLSFFSWSFIKKDSQILAFKIESSAKKKTFPEQTPVDLSLDTISLLKDGEHPSKADWNHQVNSILNHIEKGSHDLSKVVLSRARHYKIKGLDENDLTSTAIFLKLAHSFKEQTNLYNYFSKGLYEEDFMSFSPEGLFSLHEQATNLDIKLEAIAGTRPRGLNPHEDKNLEAELFQSTKEQNEHRSVVKAIVQSLKSFGKIETKAQEVLKLKSLQHLRTPITLTCPKETNLKTLHEKLTAALHPTPAVGGAPKEAALQLIRDLEGQPRNFYAGLAGLVYKKHTEMTVTIRSLSTKGLQLKAFGGAGIVDGSTPEGEWEETGQKIDSFLSPLWERRLAKENLEHSDEVTFEL